MQWITLFFIGFEMTWMTRIPLFGPGSPPDPPRIPLWIPLFLLLLHTLRKQSMRLFSSTTHGASYHIGV